MKGKNVYGNREKDTCQPWDRNTSALCVAALGYPNMSGLAHDIYKYWIKGSLHYCIKPGYV